MKLEGSSPGRLALTPENDEDKELLKGTLDIARDGDRHALLYWGDAEAEDKEGHLRGWTAFIINAHQPASPKQSAPPTVEQAEIETKAGGGEPVASPS